MPLPTQPGAPAPARAAPRLATLALATIGLAGLLAVTLASPGSTRMYAWPWTLAFAAALLAPALLLILRAVDPVRPLCLPTAGGRIAAGLAAFAILAGALASPHRGPSLWWSAPLLSSVATFFVVYDWLHADPTASGQHLRLLQRVAIWLLGLVAATSVALWAAQLLRTPSASWADARNPFPLGHSNYTAGLAVLMLPAFIAAVRASRGSARLPATVAASLACVMLVSSGSRAGILALTALGAAALLHASLPRRKKLLIALAVIAATLLVAVAHPRTRAMLAPTDPAVAPNASNVQRTAMLHAARLMGTDRPWLGWGPGTTPLVYPRYRAELNGGAENVLQLHSVPAQLWAELGLAGLVAAAACGVFVVRHSRRDAVASTALCGYAVFALFDWQLDVPIFGFAIATCAALLAPDSVSRNPRHARGAGLATLGALSLVVAFGRTDPTPELNVRALAAADRDERPHALALLRESLAHNPHQEIAHLNLGWLLVVDAPDDAAAHFLSAARLVPDKGSVYFGLGLARLNAGDRPAAIRAIALECLNDPAFLLSPWWHTPAVAVLRADVLARLQLLHERAASRLPPGSWASQENRYTHALAAWIGGRGSLEAVRTHASTARRDLLSRFASSDAPPLAPPASFRRERTGYPVLMRNLDLPPPVDVFDPQDGELRSGPWAPLFPTKGWLPSPLLLALLDEPFSANP